MRHFFFLKTTTFITLSLFLSSPMAFSETGSFKNQHISSRSFFPKQTDGEKDPRVEQFLMEVKSGLEAANDNLALAADGVQSDENRTTTQDGKLILDDLRGVTLGQGIFFTHEWVESGNPAFVRYDDSGGTSLLNIGTEHGTSLDWALELALTSPDTPQVLREALTELASQKAPQILAHYEMTDLARQWYEARIPAEGGEMEDGMRVRLMTEPSHATRLSSMGIEIDPAALEHHWNPAAVVVGRNEKLGFTVFVSLDHPRPDTRQGAAPSFGGAAGATRIGTSDQQPGIPWYPRPVDALLDAINLSGAMTNKAAPYVDKGGSKTTIRLDRPMSEEELEKAILSVGRLIEHYKLTYTGSDMGFSEKLLYVYSTVAPSFIFGHPKAPLKGVDSAPWAASGAVAAMEAILKVKEGPDATLKGVSVALQGVGNVGMIELALLVERGAKVVIHDQRIERIREAEQEFAGRVKFHITPGTEFDPNTFLKNGEIAILDDYDGRASELNSIYRLPVKIFSPAAQGGILNAKTIPLLRAEYVIGPANNQFARSDNGTNLQNIYALHKAGIIHGPDPIVNAGGFLAVHSDVIGINEGWMLTKIAEYSTRVLTKAIAENIPPLVMARILNRQLIQKHDLALLDQARNLVAADGVNTTPTPSTLTLAYRQGDHDSLERAGDGIEIDERKNSSWAVGPYENTAYAIWHALVSQDRAQVMRLIKNAQGSDTGLVRYRFIDEEDLKRARTHKYTFEGEIHAPEAEEASRIAWQVLKGLVLGRPTGIFRQAVVIALEGVLQHAVSEPARGTGLLLVFAERVPQNSKRLELWAYVMDSGPGMPVGRVVFDGYRASTGRRGEAIGNLIKGRVDGATQDPAVTTEWMVVSQNEQYNRASHSITQPSEPMPSKGSLFAVHMISNRMWTDRQGDGLVGDGAASPEAQLRQLGYLRNAKINPAMYRPDLGQMMYEQVAHTLSPVIFVDSLDLVQTNLQALENFKQALPEQFQVTQTTIILPSSLLDQARQTLSAAYPSLRFLSHDETDMQSKLLAARNATVNLEATITITLNGSAAYNAHILMHNLRRLIDYMHPSNSVRL